MSIKASVYHLTHYKYDRPVVLGPQIIRLRPAPHSRTRVISHSLKVSPAKHFVNYQQDLYGNWLARYVFPEPVRELKIEVDLVADMTVYNPFDFFVEETAESYPFAYPPEIAHDLEIYLKPEPLGPLLKKFLSTVSREKIRTVDFIVGLNARVSNETKYLIRLEPGVQTPEETLKKASGSCRDSSWLLVNALRHLGLAARFVSGYLIQLKPDLIALDGPVGTSVDFTDLHAWCEVYLPGAGWIGLDPTSGLLTGESHIPLAATPHYGNAAPISGGLTGNPKVEFEFDMKVARVAEHPRITKPFSDESWAALDALGEKVDAALKEGDVRLTMGGEPTFVSIDDFEGDEWNTGADGPTKRKLADKLIQRLRDRFAPGGFLHYGQGKWYPGETLPRWTFSLYWRRDGKPIWQDPDLVAGENGDGKATKVQAEQLLQAIAEELNVGSEMVIPAYEDTASWILKEGNLPENVSPENSKLKDVEERTRIARVFGRGLTEPTGYVLPIQRWQAKASAKQKVGKGAPKTAKTTQDAPGRIAAPGRWKSEKWKLRRGYMFLAPGDSPVGYRLPLESLSWVAPSLYPHVIPADPAEERGPLPDFGAPAQSRARFTAREVGQQMQQPAFSEVAGTVRTAMSVEARDGRLCVFMPPVERIEDYLELVAAAEAAAKGLGIPVHIEGYAPPHDPRMNVMRVTPDPGVIEVNVHPSSSWRECVEITQTLYDEARQCRLGCDKFMIDGRHTGTGGGNHVVVGGATPMDSPFLRRPDVLKSLLLLWQKRPSLSYLFSGMFIGPTSQAPRIDEARHDTLYELEIALSQISPPGEGQYTPPWLVDRLLRNLLIDVSGNTHRTEICIDKLFSPDGPTGRLGLVEFRGIEMPPDARMSLAQQVLVRAIIARMWKSPISGNMVRWGTTLHDRFMLPHFVWEDFLDVLRDLKTHGFDLRPDWYEAQLEFRFPFCGEIEVEGVNLEVRQALEPWHVLGETGAIGGTVRYADSSAERMQVKLTANDPERYRVACNRRPVPLVQTGNGSAVAGVRFKAWKPPSSLHPILPVNAPLTFDIFDTWTNRAIGGCVYHVAHPGGRSYETFPVNGNEAEARRLARFEGHGHSPGMYELGHETPHPEFPMTLDLRRPPGV
ncbi:MAG TPA: transglutaminase family protein [Hyphomonadaceae bacterium]|nr:transglutaminase family protein [Hyphomonadaceae bacterium]HPN04298.1 transglutaminase family protein [Hyphomonadaceae bacterium]